MRRKHSRELVTKQATVGVPRSRLGLGDKYYKWMSTGSRTQHMNNKAGVGWGPRRTTKRHPLVHAFPRREQPAPVVFVRVVLAFEISNVIFRAILQSKPIWERRLAQRLAFSSTMKTEQGISDGVNDHDRGSERGRGRRGRQA